MKKQMHAEKKVKGTAKIKIDGISLALKTK
jgi:hypothetical protein